MAAGKNYICSQYESNGWLSIDADKLVHQAIKQNENVIFAAFSDDAEKTGINLKNADGSLNRRNLGALIFNSPELLKKQEQIVYPAVTELTKDFINKNPDRNIIINATVLYKTPELLTLCEKIVFVTAPAFVRFVRAKKRDHMKTAQILQRFKAQKKLLSEYASSGIPLEIVRNYYNLLIPRPERGVVLRSKRRSIPKECGDLASAGNGRRVAKKLCLIKKILNKFSHIPIEK